MDRKQRNALKNWFREYRDYATSASLALSPHSIQLHDGSKREGDTNPDYLFVKYHDDNSEAQKRVQAVLNLKSVGDIYGLYGDVIYYYLMVGAPMEAVCSRLLKYHDLLDVDDETRYYPTPNRVYQWTRKAIEEMADIVPVEWYRDNNK